MANDPIQLIGDVLLAWLADWLDGCWLFLWFGDFRRNGFYVLIFMATELESRFGVDLSAGQIGSIGTEFSLTLNNRK